MTISVTELARKSAIGSGANSQSPTFTTVDGGEIWVAITGGNATAFGIASNDGGWTFSSYKSIGPVGAFNYRIQLFKATNSSAQSGRTVTVSSGSGDGYDYCVMQVLGSYEEVQYASTNGATGEPATIGTLGAAATNGNFCIMVAGFNEDGINHSSVSVSGWTNESVNVWSPSANLYYGINVYSKTDFTGTSVSITEYASTPEYALGFLLELAEPSGVPGAPTIRGWAAATNTADALPAVVLNLPTRVSGDLLLAFAAGDASTAFTHSQTTTWAELSDEAGTGANRLAVYGRIASNDANDALSIAGGNNADASFNMVAITVGTHNVTDPATQVVLAAAATGASGNADPPSLDGGSSKNWLAIAAACVDLTATGSAITAAPTNYTTDAILQKSAASTSSVALGVGPRRLTSTQTENPGAFTNTSGAWIAKTLLVPPVPPAPNDGAASGAIAWVGSADGEAPVSIPQGSASGSIAWVGSSTGITSRSGSGSGAIGWVGSSTGTTVRRGDSNGAVAWVGSSTGSRTPKGSCTGAISWVGSADGDAPLDLFDGAGNGAISWVGSATGARSSQGASAGAISWVGVAIGADLGVAIGAIAWVGSATGVRTPKGSSTGAIAWVGSATGETPAVGVNDGSVSGAITWVGSATGQSPYKGSTSGSISWVGSAVGSRSPKGLSTGVITWVGSADGDAPTVGPHEGSASGVISWVGVSVGQAPYKGDSTGVIAWVGVAVGSTVRIGSADGTITWVGVVTAIVRVDPATFLLVPHVLSRVPKVVSSHIPKVAVGHKPLIAKGRDGG